MLTIKTKLAAASLVLTLASVCVPAMAQAPGSQAPSPFDMSPERPKQTAPQTPAAGGSAPAPAAPAIPQGNRPTASPAPLPSQPFNPARPGASAPGQPAAPSRPASQSQTPNQTLGQPQTQTQSPPLMQTPGVQLTSPGQVNVPTRAGQALTPNERDPRQPAGGAATPAPTGTQASAASEIADPSRRYLVPSPNLRLGGEIEQRSWTVVLTADEAAAGAKLHFAYQNAVVVAPEASSLTITVNDVPVYAEKIASSDQPSDHAVEIPAGLLRAGSNTLRFGANQRHRTDCTIESTYELWTDIDPQRTFFTFDNDRAGRFSRLDDLRAVGLDGEGNTRYRLIVPALDQMGATDVLMRLSEGLSLMGAMPNQSFAFQKTTDGALRPGELPVFVGTPDELRTLLPGVPAAAASAAVASFVDYPGSNGVSALVLSGPSWPAIQTLIDSFVATADTGSNQRRETLLTANWTGVDTPFLFGDSTINLSSMGVTSEEFSGRLFRTRFTVGVPADFYANAYGEARILLDAAYTADVLPGSHIDIFVNGNLASTVPITSKGGAILRHLPIKLTLRHFKPGVNQIAIEAALVTNADKACVPGSTAETKPRFVLFGSSEFHMPDFAHIAQVPNLSAVAGTGFPFTVDHNPVSLFLGRIDEPTLSAAATFLGKIAMASHRVIPVNVTLSTVRTVGPNALFVGTVSDFPSNVLSQLKIDQATRSNWAPGDAAPQPAGRTLTLQDWQQRSGDNFLSRQFSSVSDWAKRNFDLSSTMLRFAPASDALYKPPATAEMLIAQESDPTQAGTWTAVIAPDSEALQTGMEAFSTRDAWSKLEGRVAVYSGPATETTIVPVSWFRFMPTQSLSLSNARLIAANWLSDNIMSYGLLLVAGAILLGLATAGLLSMLGRNR
jgi:hypothetical protein